MVLFSDNTKIIFKHPHIKFKYIHEQLYMRIFWKTDDLEFYLKYQLRLILCVFNIK